MGKTPTQEMPYKCESADDDASLTENHTKFLSPEKSPWSTS